MEQAGYYYDEKLKRYFKKVSQKHHLTPSASNVLNREDSTVEQQYTVGNQSMICSLRDRSHQLESTDISDQILGCLSNTKAIPLSDGFIKDIKIEAVASEILTTCSQYYDYSQSGRHFLASIFKFFKLSNTKDGIDVQLVNQCTSKAVKDLIYGQQCINDIYYYNDSYQVVGNSYPCLMLIKLTNSTTSNIQWNLTVDYLPFFTKNILCFNWETQDTILYGLCDGKIIRHTLADYNHTYFKLEKNSSINDVIPFDKFIFCAGSSSGCVHLYDYRCKQTVKKLCIPSVSGRRSPVVKLHPLASNFQLITSAINSQLHLWDLRTDNIVFEFPNHLNVFSRTSSIVDTRNSFLAAVTDQHDVLFWSLHSGRIIHRLSIDVKDIPRPSICHTHHLGGVNGPPAIMVGIGNEIIIYSLRK